MTCSYAFSIIFKEEPNLHYHCSAYCLCLTTLFKPKHPNDRKRIKGTKVNVVNVNGGKIIAVARFTIRNV